MSRRLKIGLTIFLLLVIGLVTTALANGTNPGSIDDPIVTKSYVDEQISKIVLTGGTSSGGVAPIIVETLNTGDILIAGAGTEIILRGGVAVVYGEGSNGLPNVTAGKDLTIGSNVPLNHHLIVPRDDGRGIKATKGPAYVMVRGNYTITRQ
ncbi:MAG: hypothetical protein AB7V16_09025 [Vulcanibacillus sp.]